MARRKKTIKEEPKDDVPEKVEEEKKPEPVKEEPVQEHILVKDLNHNLKKGDKVQHEKYVQLVNAGFEHLFK